MTSKLLTLLAALAVGTATGAAAFTSVRDAGPAPEPPVSVPVAPVQPADDPCADPASTDPACVVVVPVPAAASVGTGDDSFDDDGTVDRGRGDEATAPAAPPVKLRGDGTVDDCCGGADDDRSGRRGGDDHDRNDRDDDRDDHDDRDEDVDDDGGSPDDDGTPDQGSGDR